MSNLREIIGLLLLGLAALLPAFLVGLRARLSPKPLPIIPQHPTPASRRPHPARHRNLSETDPTRRAA